MSNQDRLIDAKVSILQLAEKLESISEACKVAGIARSSFYEIKKAYEQFGREGLYPRARRKPRMPNQFPEEIVNRILEMTRKEPSFSYVRIASQLQLQGISVSPGGVRKVWERHGLVRKLSRYLWLERESAEGRGIMTERALKAIARMKRLEEATDQHVEANRPGELLSQDLYFVGHIKGIGKIYAQSAVDCSCSVGFARLCISKQPIHSVALVHERIIPFYDGLGLQLSAILTDGGREYCGRADNHFYELYLGSQNVEHRVTRPASPYTNGFVERFHRTLKDEFFAKVFREKIYTTLEELQKDLDGFLEYYNSGRAHSGYRCQGRTPMKTLKDLLEQPTSELTELQAA
jgi:transposase